MSSIFRIAYFEIRSLFFSPIAWLLLIAFIVPAGMDFAAQLLQVYKSAYLGNESSNLTQQLFGAPNWGLFAGIQSKAYFYIPLLTMGLISRELASGTIKLLYSSPVTVPQIVFGKYLAVLAYAGILTGILVLFVIATSLSIASADMPYTVPGLIGLYLLIAAYGAIGLFMSSLTTYQVVAALTTLIVLAALDYIGTVGQQYDVVRDLTYFLSISGRAGSFIGGLISSKDIAYFLIIIATFLSFCILKLQSGREVIRPWVAAGRYIAVIIIALLLGYVTSRPAMWRFYDMTANKDMTLTASSRAIVSRLKKPMSITTYVNLLDGNSGAAFPQRRIEDMSRFDTFIRFKPDLEMRYVYYYDDAPDSPELVQANPGISMQQLAQRVADTEDMKFDRFLPPEKIHQLIDLRPERNRLVRVVEYDGRRTFLRMFQDSYFYPGEAEIAAAMKRLTVTPPKAAFLTGHGERRLDRSADADYRRITREGGFRAALLNQGFEVVSLELGQRPVPEDVDILVIADPKQSLGGELRRIQDFIARGGNVLVAADPGDQATLNPLLESLGIEYTAGNLRQSNPDLGQDFVVATLADGAFKKSADDSGLFDLDSRVRGGFADLASLRKVSMPMAMGVRQIGSSDFAVHPVMLAPPGPDSGERVPVAVGLTRWQRGKEQRLMVVGDADFMSNQEISRSNLPAANTAFTLEVFKWLSYGEYPVDTKRPPSKDNSLLIGRDAIDMWKLIFCGILPGSIALVGAILLIRRRRR